MDESRTLRRHGEAAKLSESIGAAEVETVGSRWGRTEQMVARAGHSSLDDHARVGEFFSRCWCCVLSFARNKETKARRSQPAAQCRDVSQWMSSRTIGGTSFQFFFSIRNLAALSGTCLVVRRSMGAEVPFMRASYRIRHRILGSFPGAHPGQTLALRALEGSQCCTPQSNRDALCWNLRPSRTLLH